MIGRWRAWVILGLGFYLLASPWWFESANAKYALNATLVGASLAIAAFGVRQAFRPWPQLVNLVLGVWLLASPSILGDGGVGLSGVMIIIVVGSCVTTLAAWDLCSNDPERTAA